jgi:HEAT repeat protein
MNRHPGGPEKIGAAMFIILLVFSSHPVLPSVGSAWAEEPAIREQIDVKQLSALVRDGKQSDRARIKAAKILAESEDPKALEPLFDVIRDSNERPLLKAAITRTLGKSPQKEPVVAFLVGKLQDHKEAAEVRAVVATTLGWLKVPSSKAVLVHASTDPEPAVRQAARSAILALGGEGVDQGGILIATLQDAVQPAAVRASAARQLGELKDPRALPPLTRALREKPPDIPKPQNPGEFFASRAALQGHLPAAAARALGQLGKREAVPDLLSLTEAAETELRIAVYEALALLKAREAVPAARKALVEDQEQRVRRWAVVLLRGVSVKDALPELRRALSDPDPGVRLQAAQAVGAMQDRQAIEPLEKALAQETTKEVKEAISEALRLLKAPAPPLGARPSPVP